MIYSRSLLHICVELWPTWPEKHGRWPKFVIFWAHLGTWPMAATCNVLGAWKLWPPCPKMIKMIKNPGRADSMRRPVGGSGRKGADVGRTWVLLATQTDQTRTKRASVCVAPLESSLSHPKNSHRRPNSSRFGKNPWNKRIELVCISGP